MDFLSKHKYSEKKGRIKISPDILKEIFEKLSGEFLNKNIEIFSIDYDYNSHSFYADCYSDGFEKMRRGATIPVVYELHSRREITPTEAFRRSRKISKIIHASQIEKKVIPKKKKINEKSYS